MMTIAGDLRMTGVVSSDSAGGARTVREDAERIMENRKAVLTEAAEIYELYTIALYDLEGRLVQIDAAYDIIKSVIFINPYHIQGSGPVPAFPFFYRHTHGNAKLSLKNSAGIRSQIIWRFPCSLWPTASFWTVCSPWFGSRPKPRSAGILQSFSSSPAIPHSDIPLWAPCAAADSSARNY